MTGSTSVARPALAIVALLIAACGTDTGAPDTASVEPAPQPEIEASPAPSTPDRPLTVFDTEGPSAIRPVMEAWRAEGGERFAIAESGISTTEDVVRLKAAGAKGLLVGESLMRQAGVAEATRNLLD